MGFKALFKRKKKQRDGDGDANANANSDTSPTTAPVQAPMINSRSSSLNGRSRLEEELEQVFKKFDVNGDGKISASELGSILRSVGQPATEEELRIMIQEVDADGDGFIDLQEFIALNTTDVGHEEVMENLRDAFKVFDIDKNGYITAEELQDVLQSLGEECTLDECEKMISGVDSDGSGTINFDEFKVMMTKGFRSDTAEPAV
ncbi:UNVERIFIED_CONTAM: putative calcium-binding protein CML25 [Sesamum latifolium]|uniref:Calcium-binding protein CML25 n=1 Tax=Sesamum latifolium TaxID=2727402 RepID=A0AAW2X385_9LAMI